jgi:hypothetical protein
MYKVYDNKHKVRFESNSLDSCKIFIKEEMVKFMNELQPVYLPEKIKIFTN